MSFIWKLLFLISSIVLRSCPFVGSSVHGHYDYSQNYHTTREGDKRPFSYYNPNDIVEVQYDYKHQPYVLSYRYAAEMWRRHGGGWYYAPQGQRMRLGRGSFSLLAPSDAELRCEFPRSEQIISNVVWVRPDLSHLEARELHYLNQEDGNSRYYHVTSRPRGSTLFLRRVVPLDTGLYRCVASARDPVTGVEQTVFQDIEFFPRP